MNLFGTPSQPPPSERNAQRDEDSRRSIASGGLPLNAVDRLTEQAARQGKSGQSFTSDLSVNELAAIADAGYEPLGQVMGSCIYHIGWQYLPTYSWNSGEMQMITQAFHNARHLALNRILQEAALLEATDVAGVRLELRQYDWGVGLLEFTAFGSAIRLKSAHRVKVTPSISLLSGQELWLLNQAGYHAVGVATGNCSWYEVASWNTILATQGGSLWGTTWQNQELTDYTQAIYQARSLASHRMEIEGRGYGAEGVVGVTIQMNMETRDVETNNQQSRKDLIVHFSTMGTAITKSRANSIPLSLNNAVTLDR